MPEQPPRRRQVLAPPPLGWRSQRRPRQVLRPVLSRRRPERRYPMGFQAMRDPMAACIRIFLARTVMPPGLRPLRPRSRSLPHHMGFRPTRARMAVCIRFCSAQKTPRRRRRVGPRRLRLPDQPDRLPTNRSAKLIEPARTASAEPLGVSTLRSREGPRAISCEALWRDAQPAPWVTAVSALHLDFADLNDRCNVSVVWDIGHDFLGVRAEGRSEGVRGFKIEMTQGHERRFGTGCRAFEAVLDRHVLAGAAELLSHHRHVGVAIVVDIELAALVARVQYGHFDHVTSFQSWCQIERIGSLARLRTYGCQLLTASDIGNAGSIGL